ncbi:transcriptional regulator [Pseudoalteromonas sp. CO325X]|nr:helix-turn-helix domain-containing protein [Pseudoalteromonas sp. CO325X]RZF83745.1 transcriptional regulator [Pseudoalteromonas sp. CO325X]
MCIGWSKADIKAAIEKEGWSLRQLSLSRGYCAGAMQSALHRPYPKAERIIAEVIGESPVNIWPERYGVDGKPNRRRGRPVRKPEL